MSTTRERWIEFEKRNPRIIENYPGQQAIAFAQSEVKLEREHIIAWLRGAPDRMATQYKVPGLISIGPLYDAGQLAACAQTVDYIEQGRDKT